MDVKWDMTENKKNGQLTKKGDGRKKEGDCCFQFLAGN